MSDARMTALGEMHPDFSGPSYTQAKRIMLVVGPEDPDAELGPDETAPTVGILDDLSAMADKLSQSSDLHAEQADRLRQIVSELSEQDGPDSDSAEADQETSRLTSGEPMD
jgi:hypothetical protein